MIRFACPRCKTVLERPEQDAGAKFACTSCGQRLQVPPSPIDKTMLGDVNWQKSGAAAAPVPEAAPAAGDAQVRLVRGREHVVWACPLCETQVSVPLEPWQAAVRCPQCAKRIDVPHPGPRGGEPNQQIKARDGVAVPPVPSPADSDVLPPRARERERDRWDEDDAPPPRRRPRWDDDSGIRRYTRTGRPADEEDCARSSTTGFFCSLVSVAMIFIAFVLWVVMIAERPLPGQADPFVFLILLLGLVGFVMGLIGVVFSSRGLDPINQRNRGLAVAGLVCGILGMVVGLIGSAFFFCIGMVLMSAWR
jgi:DNA-directed RNA polymerase subunit RPC12/RpoP